MTCGFGVCDVCRLLEGNTQQKMVCWCGLCQAWLCDKCRNNPVRRALAAAKQKLGV